MKGPYTGKLGQKINSRLTSTAIGGRRKMQPPLTPMIDVVFQLLFFFLTATTFRQVEGQIPAGLASAQGQLSSQTVEQILKPVVIHIRPADQAGQAVYEVTGTVGTVGQPLDLFEHLEQLRQTLGGSDVPILISPREQVEWQYVVEAFNQAVRAGFTSVGFSPDPRSD